MKIWLNESPKGPKSSLTSPSIAANYRRNLVDVQRSVLDEDVELQA